MMAETLKINLFINGLVHSSKAETVTSLSVFYSQGPGHSLPAIVWILIECVKHKYIYTYIDK